MNNTDYFRVLRDGWWIIIAAILVSTGIATAYSYTLEPTYEATASFVANPSIQISNTDDILYSLDTLANRSTLVNTFCEILASRAILEKAEKTLPLEIQGAPSFLDGDTGDVRCSVIPESSVIQLTVSGPSPGLTADLANAVGDAGIVYIKDLQEVFELHELDDALPDSSQVSPNHMLDIGFGFVVGAIGGIAIAFLRYLLQRQPEIVPSILDERLQTR